MANAATTPPPPESTNKPAVSEAQSQELLTAYKALLKGTSPLPPALAAISALTNVLSNTSTLTTTSETLALTSSLICSLKYAVSNPLPLTAGTDLFQRYLLNTLNHPSPAASPTTSGTSFNATKSAALSTATLFVERGQQLAQQIAHDHAAAVIRPGATVLTYAYSPAVEAVILAAARIRTRFRLVAVLPADAGAAAAATTKYARLVREMGVPVAVVPSTGLAHALALPLGSEDDGLRFRAVPTFEGRLSVVLLGADAVLASGGALGPLGTYQAALLAQGRGLPVYVVAETFRFVRALPLGQGDLGAKEAVVKFEEKVDTEAENGYTEDAIDLTPPELITGIITESGILTPSAVCEELIKIWF